MFQKAIYVGKGSNVDYSVRGPFDFQFSPEDACHRRQILKQLGRQGEPMHEALVPCGHHASLKEVKHGSVWQRPEQMNLEGSIARGFLSNQCGRALVASRERSGTYIVVSAFSGFGTADGRWGCPDIGTTFRRMPMLSPQA